MESFDKWKWLGIGLAIGFLLGLLIAGLIWLIYWCCTRKRDPKPVVKQDPVPIPAPVVQQSNQDFYYTKDPRPVSPEVKTRVQYRPEYGSSFKGHKYT